ncbi:MAG: hypothetical protein QW097_01765 [archaeon]
MDTDHALILMIIALFLYIAKYSLLSYLLFGLSIILLLFSLISKKKEEKESKQEMLKPIYIKSKRTAPYVMPEKISLKYKPEEEAEPPWWVKASKSFGKVFKSLFK